MAPDPETMPDIGPGYEWYRELADDLPLPDGCRGRAPGDVR